MLNGISCGYWFLNIIGGIQTIGSTEKLTKEMKVRRKNSKRRLLNGPSKAKTPVMDFSVIKKLRLKDVNPGAYSGEWIGSGKLLKSISPINGEVIASVRTATPEEYERTVQRAQEAFRKWKNVPAPKHNKMIRQLNNALQKTKSNLG